jgi:hypothetical protein
MKQIEVVSKKFSMVTTEAELTRLESELSFSQGQVDDDASGEDPAGEGPRYAKTASRSPT